MGHLRSNVKVRKPLESAKLGEALISNQRSMKVIQARVSLRESDHCQENRTNCPV